MPAAARALSTESSAFTEHSQALLLRLQARKGLLGRRAPLPSWAALSAMHGCLISVTLGSQVSQCTCLQGLLGPCSARPLANN